MKVRPPAIAICGTLLLAGFCLSQQAEVVWQDLFMKALNYHGAKDYAKAEQTFNLALHEAERFGPMDPRVGTSLNSLGLTLRDGKKFAESEAAYRKALVIFDKAYGPDSIDVGNVNFNIANVMFDQGHQTIAFPYLQRSLAIYEALLGGVSLKTAAALCMLGDAYRLQKSYKEAEIPLRRCADIREADGGMRNADLAEALHSLALVYQAEGKYTQAEPRFRLAEKIREGTLGIMSPVLAQTMEDHAALLHQMGRDIDATRLTTMAGAIRRHDKKP